MINPTELRKGNTFMLKPGKACYGEKHITVESYANGRINVYFRDYKIEDIEPIPLTPEILEAAEFFPFVDVYGNTLYIKDGFTRDADFNDRKSLWYNLKDKEFVVTSTPYDDVTIPCEFLHTLQNIFYIHSGCEELSINTPILHYLYYTNNCNSFV